MSETIRILKDRMKFVSSEIQKFMDEKKEIQTALDAIEEIKNCENLGPFVKDTDKIKLSDTILKTLQKFDRPMSIKEILHAMQESGVETTQGSISATLSRMKTKHHVENERGKWQMLPLLNDHVDFKDSFDF
jgi:hypothetical protein